MKSINEPKILMIREKIKNLVSCTVWGIGTVANNSKEIAYET